MRLHGSLQNRLWESAKQPTPEVGMAATVLSYTDRHPATVIAVGKVVTVQEDKAKRTDANGMSECQSYDYARNPEGRVWHFRRLKDGWREVYQRPETGRWCKADGAGLGLGYREKYHDFSF